MKDKKMNQPTIAQGMDTGNELKKPASKREIKKGDYTKVTTVSLDENDPS